MSRKYTECPIIFLSKLTHTYLYSLALLLTCSNLYSPSGRSPCNSENKGKLRPEPDCIVLHCFIWRGENISPHPRGSGRFTREDANEEGKRRQREGTGERLHRTTHTHAQARTRARTHAHTGTHRHTQAHKAHIQAHACTQKIAHTKHAERQLCGLS